ncbi:hypothetical protein NUW58_g4141 [Xylaria curta]|uniref:Uncharacterized protein n=1 Tax=Xylaria curta TaxID=42375 RepID=A0ACC1P7P9_9PEZI|nr:hypothetical protein NUW58_g4141 [Xylaria curta]
MSSTPFDPHEPVAIVGMGCRWPGGVCDSSQFWDFLSNKIDDARLFDHAFFGMTSLEVETMDPSQRKLLEVAYEAIDNAGETWDSVSGSRTGVFVGNFCLDHWMIQSRDWDNPRPYAFTGAGTSILANRISYVFNLQGPSLTVDTACSSSMYALHLAVKAIRTGDCDAAIVASANWIADPGVQIALDKLGALSASSRCHTFDARAQGYARGEGFGALYLKRLPLAISDRSPIRAVIRGTAINSNGRTGGITRPSAKGQEMVIRQAYQDAGDLNFHDTSYFECHGTGTYVGDPIEVAAVGKVFAADRSDPLLVGSVKNSVGHGEGASALASIMKVVLSLEKGAIAPIFNLETRNPNIDFDGAKVRPVTEITPWPEHRLRRASINSFGYGGANGHCIIDHVNNVLPDYIAPGVFRKKLNGEMNGHSNGHQNRESVQHRPAVLSFRLNPTANATARQLVLLPLSAHNENSLKSNVEALSRIIDKLPLADVAYTLGARRSKFAQRSFCIVSKGHVARDLVVDKIVRAPLQTTNVGFVFTGQGAQWHGMGAELFDYRTFRKTIEYLDYVLGMLPNPPPWSLDSILSGNCDGALIQTAEVSQTACTGIQIGLVDLLASWSIRPSGVVGHSSGEIAAAYAAGRITAAQAITAAYLRGQAVSKNPHAQNGAMLAVGLGPEGVSKYCKEDGVRIAAVNSPGSVTLSGEAAVIEKISTAMTADNIFNRKLKTGGNAYHSHHMVPIGRQYADMLVEGAGLLRDLGLDSSEQRYEHVPWISSVTPHKSTDSFDNASSYWRDNLESPVLFSDAIVNLLDQGVPIHALVEIGPHPALKSPLDQIFKASGKALAYCRTLQRQEGGQMSVLRLAGILFGLNATVNLAVVNAIDAVQDTELNHGSICLGLPPYQYTYGGLNYHESRGSKEYRYRSVLRHDLLGSKLPGTSKLQPQWRNIIRIKDLPWLSDHRLGSDPVLPGAAYIAMAIEAASRMHNESATPSKIKGFSLRDLTIDRSLLIPEDDYGVEVVTSMGIATVTGPSLPWATFSINSVRRVSDEWVEHCTGQVRIEVEVARQDIQDHRVTPTAPRRIDALPWYQKFSDIGLNYGPCFQTLSNIRTNPESNLAVATLALHPTSTRTSESPYALHPASLDGAIQLGLIACHGGQLEKANTAFVPVRLSHLYLQKEISGDTCTVVARGERRGIRSVHLELQILGPSGDVCLHVDDLRCISYSRQSNPIDRTFSSPFTRLIWRPDIRSMSNRQARQIYVPSKDSVEVSLQWGITNRLAHYVLLNTYERFGKLRDRPQPSGDVGHFFDWIKRKAETDRSDLMNEARKLANNGLLLQAIEELSIQGSDIMEIKVAKLLHDNMSDIIYERKTGIDTIISEGFLTPFYQAGLLMTGTYPQLFEVLSNLAHSNPNLRILEIGGGTGGATRIAMKAFQRPNGIKAYRDYTFTDISPGFLSSARDSMADFLDMKFSIFDIELDPMEQGYTQEYDLIIACQVLHVTSNMHRTLSNCRRLLNPGGKLLLVETTKNFIVPGIVVGTFTGYWAGIPDGRVDAPFQSLDAWESSLRDAGFSGLDIVLDDFPEPHSTTSVILSTVPPAVTTPSPTDVVHILYSDEPAPSLVWQISKELMSRGVIAKAGVFNEVVDRLPPKSRVIVLIDERHLLVKASGQDIMAFQHLARNVATCIALTSCGVVKGRNADGALIAGLFRVLQNENPASQYITVDIDTEDFALAMDSAQEFSRCIVDYEFELHQDTPDGNLKDHEFAWQSGCMWVSRHVPDTSFNLQYGLGGRSLKTELVPLNSQGAIKVMFETPGVLNSLCFTSNDELVRMLDSDFIDVATAAIGVNSKTLNYWAGRLDENHFPLEYAGIVTAVGANVRDLSVGDRVYGLGKDQFGNYLRVPAAFASKLGPDDNMAQMASMPWAYTTAIYALDYVAHLTAGQSVLIQSGTKDVGMASIALAKSKGAIVFATVDAPEEAKVLAEELGMAASRILSAPSFADLQRASKSTRGGFDVILSIATGDLLDSFSRVLAPLGHLIDVGGQNDVREAPFLSRQLLQKNASFSSVDPLIIIDANPSLGLEIVRSIDRYYRGGDIRPIQKITAFDISQTSSALSAFSSMIGKLVISFENTENKIKMAQSSPSVTFDSNSYYVVTGAFGGLGQSMIKWMADRGARYLALLSRRHVSNAPGAQELIDSLASYGTCVKCFICDVSEKDEVATVIRQISSARPIRGIVHAAVSYLDMSFDKLESSRWRESIAAKVEGTKNLHEATLSLSIPLDFFIMITSALSVYAFPTQGAYTAANNFQDAFARFRRGIGLPASTVSFSLVRESTNVGTSATTVDLFKRNKAPSLDESRFLALLEPAFLNNKIEGKTGSTSWFGQSSDPLSAANLHTYLDPFRMIEMKRDEIESNTYTSAIAPRWHGDGRVSLMLRAFLDAQRKSADMRVSQDEGGKNTVAQLRASFDAAVRQGGAYRDSTVTLVQAAITTTVAEMLFVDAESIDPVKSVADLGVDSLIAAELRSWLNQALGADISMLDLLEPNMSIITRAVNIVDKALSASK